MTSADLEAQDDRLSDDSVEFSDDDRGAPIDMKTVRRWFRNDAKFLADWRKRAEEDFRFYAGEHYSTEEKTQLREQRRPDVVFNRVQPTINVVSGAEISNRQETKYLPRTIDDAEATELMSGAGDWYRDTAGSEDEESDSFRDMLVCGIGVVENVLDYIEDADGAPSTNRIDPLECWYDCAARKPNLGDARRVWRVRELDREEAREMFPDVEDGDLSAERWVKALTEPESTTHMTPFGYEDTETEDPEDAERRTVFIAELQWKVRVPIWRVEMPDGQVADIEEAMVEQAQQIGLKVLQQQRWCIYKAFIGRKVLEWQKLVNKDPRTGKDQHAPCFTLQFMTGLRDQTDGTWFGLVRPMKDPQRWANKFFSTTMHLFNVSAKGGVLAERGAVDHEEQFEKTYSRADAVTWLDDGALSNPNGPKIQPKPVAPFPASTWQMMQFAIDSIRDATGVNQEMLGLRDATQPGVLEYQRKQAGMTIIAAFFDALRRYRKKSGALVLYYIQNFLSDGRLIRITGRDDDRVIALLRDQTAGTYDVIVDQASTSPDMKAQVWQVIQPLFTILPPEIQMTVLKYSPLPASLVSEIQSKVAELQEQGPPPDPKMELEKAKAEMQMQAQAAAHEQAMMKAQIDLQIKNADLQMKGMDLEIKKIEAQADLAKAQAQVQAAYLAPRPVMNGADLQSA